MKKILLTLTLASTILFGFLVTSCESTASKKKAEETKIEEAEQAIDEIEIEAAEDAVSNDEWTSFKNDWQQMIDNNDKRIAEIRSNMNQSGKVINELRAKRIAELEQRNKDLRARLNQFEKNQSNWEQFKSEFQRDMDAIGDAFQDLSEDNQ
jgi:chromosome segregation ATPase